MYNRTDKDKHYRLLIEVFENSFFIKITDLEWHKVSMDNIEEVTKIHSAINKYKEIEREKVEYEPVSDILTRLETKEGNYLKVYSELYKGRFY